MSVTPTFMQETWRPTQQRVVVSEGGSRVAAAKPSLLGAVPAGVAADKAVAAASVLAVIPVPMAGVASEVTLTAPPPLVAVEETREGEFPISLSGGPHGLSLPSEPKAPEGSMAGIESGRPTAVNATDVVEILSDDEAEVVADPPVLSWGLVVVQPKAGPSGGPTEGDLEWRYPKDPAKARFVLRDS